VENRGDTGLSILPPAYVSRRGDRYLLVWDSPAQWISADRELLDLIGLLDGSRSLDLALAQLAGGNGGPPAQFDQAARDVLAELDRRGLLADRPVAVEPEEISLANITVNLTNRCNLRCPWCYNADRATAEVPVELLMAAISAARDCLAPDASLNILGGEPLLDRDRLLKCLELSRGLFSRPVMVSTNGTLLDQELADALAGFDVEVQVSLDAPDAAGHDALRGPGVFDKALASVRLLRQRGIPVILSMVFDAEGHRQFEDYLRLGQRLGVREVRFIPLRLIGRAARLSDRRPDLLAALGEVRRIRMERPRLAALLGRDYFSILGQVCAAPGQRTGCGLGRKVLFIDADGGIYPCPNLTTAEYFCGNVKDASIREVIHNSPVFRRLQQACQVRRRPACSACTYRHWCAGDCRAEAASGNGDLFSPAVHCGEMPRLIEETLWDISTRR